MVADTLKNMTPFANMQFSNWNAQGREFGIFMVKSAWDILPDGSVSQSMEQEPFVFSDVPFGAVNQSAVRYASDLVPFKPATDVILNATSFAPGGGDMPEWDARVEVWDTDTDVCHIDKRLVVRGPCAWTKSWGAWTLTDPEPIAQLNLRYEHAFGGAVQVGEDEGGAPVFEAFPYNPVGTGFIKETGSAPIPAPQIIGLGQAPKDPLDHMPPMGVGPVPAAWLPRLPLGGTYDANWEENIWPNWPADYDFAFHNSASDGMTCVIPTGHGLRLRLTHMHPEHPEWVITVPDPGLVAHLLMRDGTRVAQALRTDTVYLDVAADRLNDPRVFLVSRVVFDPGAVDTIVLNRKGSRTPPMVAPPHPDEVARTPASDIDTQETAA